MKIGNFQLGRYVAAVSVAWILWTIAPTPSEAQQWIVEDPVCPGCEIEEREILSLGTPDGPGGLPGLPLTVSQDSLGRYWVCFSLGLPMVFDPEGTFLQTVGSLGEGPGEYRSVGRVLSLPGDSLLLLDSRLSRATILAPDLSFVRTHVLPARLGSSVVLRWPEHVVSNVDLPQAGEPRMSLVSVDLSGTPGEITGSTGSTVSDGFGASSRILAQVDSGGLWEGEVLKFALHRHDDSGQHVRSLHGRPAWFATESTWSAGSPTSPPPPVLKAMAEDQQGLVWLYFLVASDQWQRAWPEGAGQAGGHEGQLYAEFLYRTRIVVVEPDRQRTYAAHRDLDGRVVSALSDRRAAVYEVDSLGVPRVRIVELSFGSNGGS